MHGGVVRDEEPRLHEPLANGHAAQQREGHGAGQRVGREPGRLRQAAEHGLPAVQTRDQREAEEACRHGPRFIACQARGDQGASGAAHGARVVGLDRTNRQP